MRASTHCQEKNACGHVYSVRYSDYRMAKEKKFSAAEFARIGGKARAKKLTPDQRKVSARKAAQARWAKRKAASQ